jgi:tetratricopeptide (TPR) repeat protein
MKIIALRALLILMLMFFGCAMAEREHVQTGQFDISFEMNKAHEVGYIDDGIKIRTSDGYAEIIIAKDESDPDSRLNQVINILTDKVGVIGTIVESVHIDGKQGTVMTAAKGGYVALFSPVKGYSATIDSKLPPMDTTFLLESLQIDLKKYTQDSIAQSENADFEANAARNQTLQNSYLEDPIIAAQTEVEKVYRYGTLPGIGLADYWIRVGDALWEQRETAAALDAYDKALEFDPSNYKARLHRSQASAGVKRFGRS